MPVARQHLWASRYCTAGRNGGIAALAATGSRPLIYNKTVRLTLFMMLFANLVFLAWSQWIDAPATTTANGASHLPRLKLAGETMTPAIDPPADPDPPARAPALVSGLCVSVGPFDDAAGAMHGADVLRRKGFGTRSRPEQAGGPEGYWVYIPGVASDAIATQDVKRLTERGFRDASALEPSAGDRRINIGFFTVSAQANQRQLLVRKLGLKADIAERRLPDVLYWVDVAVKTGEGVLPAQDVYKGPSLRIGARPCPGGAPSPDSPPARPSERPSSQTTAVAGVTAKPS